MKKLKLYLDTSIISFIFTDDAPREREITQKLFEEIDGHDAFISSIVLEEINRAPELKKRQMLDLLAKYDIQELKFTEEAKELANKYIAEKIIPAKYQDDAFHIAIAVVNNIDVIVSWNFKHMVKLKTKREVVGVNLLMGYDEIEIYSPWEVVENV